MISTVEKKYVIFKLEEEFYGLPISNVLSIERVSKITRIPNSPKYVLGLINLRGDVIPVIDLNIKLGFKSTKVNNSSRIIVIKDDIIIKIIIIKGK